MNANIIINILIVSICVVFLNWAFLDSANGLKRIGINTLFASFSVLIIRLLIPFSVPFPLKLSIAFPYFSNTINSEIRLFNFTTNTIVLLLSIWFIVSFILLLRLIYQYIKLRNLRRVLIENNKITHTYEQTFVRLKSLFSFSKHREIRVVSSDLISEPFSFGITNSVIVIPNKEYKHNELEFILKHELFHIKTNDSFWKLLFCILKIIYWWLPTIYIASNQFSEYLEIRCDNNCLTDQLYSTKINYLECLLEELRERRNNINNPLTISMASNKSLIEKRFNIVLSKTELNKNNKRYVKIIIGLIFIISFGLTFLPYTH
ncbi:MAG: M56 family metallopeptidase [Anaerorhabdus sp.]